MSQILHVIQKTHPMFIWNSNLNGHLYFYLLNMATLSQPQLSLWGWCTLGRGHCSSPSASGFPVAHLSAGSLCLLSRNPQQSPWVVFHSRRLQAVSLPHDPHLVHGTIYFCFTALWSTAQPWPHGLVFMFPQTLKSTRKASPEAILTYLELRKKHLSPVPHGRALGLVGTQTLSQPCPQKPSCVQRWKVEKGRYWQRSFTISESVLCGVLALCEDWNFLGTILFSAFETSDEISRLTGKVPLNNQLYSLLMKKSKWGTNGSVGRAYLAGSGAIEKGFMEEEALT